jgi:fumarate hydratase class I
MPLNSSIDAHLDFGSPSDYRTLDLPGLRREGGASRLLLESSSLEGLAAAAFEDIAFRLPESQLRGFADAAADQKASDAERFVAVQLIRNAVVAADGVYPLCQDTGIGVVYGWKGGRVASVGPAGDAEALERGGAAVWSARRLRASVLAPESFVAERNTGSNLPFHIDIRAVEGEAFRLVFSAKGGGSSNRTTLSMEAPALLDERLLESRIASLVRGLGASGCPPYRITCVLGGLSPEETLYALALAGLGLLDSPGAPALRDTEWEGRILRLAAATGVGAQFGGTRLALDARAIRLPRHAASLPLGLGVSCAAARRARAIIDESGVRLERLEAEPARFLPPGADVFPGARRIDLDRPLAELARELGSLEPGTPLLLSGAVLTARDKAHARFHGLVAEDRPLPDYLKRHPIFYAGPTEAAPGRVSGSFGPTTAGRMDGWMPELLERGAALVTIAKGGRSAMAAEAIGRAGGVYLCAIGGAAALAGSANVMSSELVDFGDLGMEAVRLVRLKDLPAIVVIDRHGNDFYHRTIDAP